MISLENLKNDNRFFIDDRNLNRLFSSPIRKYELVTIAVGDIVRITDDEQHKVISLYETEAYKYIDSPNDENTSGYEKYCERYQADFRTKSVYDDLIKNMQQDLYDVHKGVIVVDEHNVIADGQHRACVLLHLFGSKYRIEVLRYYRQSAIRHFISSIKFYFIRLGIKRRIKKG